MGNQLILPEHTIQCFTLHQIKIISLFQDSILKTPAKSLQVTVVDIEFLKPHFPF